MPEFKEREAEREKSKAERLAPFIEQAMARKTWMRQLADDEIPTITALGRTVAERAPPQPADAAAG